MTALEMNPEIRARWTAALRSGEYKQGRHYLRSDAGYCCYGVLCEIAVAERIIPPPVPTASGRYHYEGCADYLPSRVCRWAGIDTYDPEVQYEGEPATLACLNDAWHSFAEIAGLIDGAAA